jgi:cytochrome c biogenesis protein CcdA
VSQFETRTALGTKQEQVVIQRLTVPYGLATIGALSGGVIGFALSPFWLNGPLLAIVTGLISYFAGTIILKQFKLPSWTTTAELKRFLNDENAPSP